MGGRWEAGVVTEVGGAQPGRQGSWTMSNDPQGAPVGFAAGADQSVPPSPQMAAAEGLYGEPSTGQQRYWTGEGRGRFDSETVPVSPAYLASSPDRARRTRADRRSRGGWLWPI